MDYPNQAGFKEHEGTSQLAAEKIEGSGRAAKLLELVLDEYKKMWPFGLTADECAWRLHEDILSIRPRVSEAFKNYYLEKTGDRRKNEYGSPCSVFRWRQP